MNDCSDILGIPISRKDLRGALGTVELLLKKGQGAKIFFVNVHTLTESSKNKALRTALVNGTYRFADGMPLVWASNFTSKRILGRACGPDTMHALLSLKSTPVIHGFIGGRVGQAALISKRFGIESVDHCPPLREFTKENAIEDWAFFLKKWHKLHPGKSPQLVWVGLGAPKQELWIDYVSRVAPNTIFLGVGAAFDFHSGLKKRAPKIFQKVGLEWFYRLCQEPQRLFHRYLEFNLRFLFLILKKQILHF